MPSILAINAGSTSIKYKLFELQGGVLTSVKEDLFENVKDYEETTKKILRTVGNLPDISAIAHRVVHGGDRFYEPVVLDDRIIEKIEEISYLAPLHNPYNLMGIRAMQGYLPDVPHIAVFDTSFYSKLPDASRFYAIPHELIEKFKIRRYGFHGTSHEYAMNEAAKILSKDARKINLITCHLGGGWSATAIKNGTAVETSMGYTPMEGLVMMTRPGDIDAGIIFELEKIYASTGGEETGSERMENIRNLLNYESGIKGLSGGINDYQELLRQVSLGVSKPKLAFDIAIHRLVKYIGAYYAILEGKLDGIVFTGRIGAGNSMTRNEVMGKLRFLGKIPAIPVEPNEELMMGRKTVELLGIY